MYGGPKHHPGFVDRQTPEFPRCLQTIKSIHVNVPFPAVPGGWMDGGWYWRETDSHHTAIG
jgi:hypothetical protein